MGWYDTGLASAIQGQAQALAGLASLKPVDYLSGIGSIMSKYGAEQEARADRDKQLAMQQQGLDIQQGQFDYTKQKDLESALAQAKAGQAYLSNMKDIVDTKGNVIFSAPKAQDVINMMATPEEQVGIAQSMQGLSPTEQQSALSQIAKNYGLGVTNQNIGTLLGLGQVGKTYESEQTKYQNMVENQRTREMQLEGQTKIAEAQIKAAKEAKDASMANTNMYKEAMLQDTKNKAMADFSIKASALGAKKYEDWIKANPTKAMDSVEQAKAKAMIANEIRTELSPVYKAYGIDISTGDTGKALTDLVNTLQTPKTEAKSAITSNTPSQNTNLRGELYDIAKKFKSANAPALVPNWLGGDKPALGRYESAQQALATKYNVPIETIRATLKDIGY